MWSNVAFSLPLNVAVPPYVSAETIRIMIEIATRTPNDINRPFLRVTRGTAVEARGLAGGLEVNIPWHQVQRKQHVLSYPMTGRSPSAEVIHPRLRSWVGRKGPRRSRLGVGQDQSVLVLVRRRVYCLPNPSLAGATVRIGRRHPSRPSCGGWLRGAPVRFQLRPSRRPTLRVSPFIEIGCSDIWRCSVAYGHREDEWRKLYWLFKFRNHPFSFKLSTQIPSFRYKGSDSGEFCKN